jgi:hypothetical protein
MSTFDKILDSGKNGTEPDYLEALALIRTIYWPKPRGKSGVAYFVTQEEIEYAARKAVEKYGIEMIKKFFDQMKENELIGMRDEWTIAAVQDDIDSFLGKAPKEKPVAKKVEVPKISDEQQSNRYMHLIYAPNQVNVDVLKGKPIEKITHLSKTMDLKYGHKAIEILMDYCIWNRLVPKKGQWTHLTVEADILAAIKWSVEKPDEYARRA